MRPGLIAAAVATALLTARSVLRNWGATKAESSRQLPGDELVPEPATSVTRAVSIDAPAAEVWRWLVQIGQDRGGMYSYDWLENLIGLRIHSADTVRPEWQVLEAGDTVRLVRPGWMGMRAGYDLTAARVEPPQLLVLRDDTWHSILAFHIHPVGELR
jgi:hypothetical protein